VAVGSPFVRWEGLTYEGTYENVCNLGGTPFIADFSAGWCGPCMDLAAGIAGQSHGYGPDLDTVRDAVSAGTLGFAEIMIDPAADYGPADQAFLQAWHDSYPNDDILLLGDDTGDSQGQGEVAWPYIAGPSMGRVRSGGTARVTVCASSVEG